MEGWEERGEALCNFNAATSLSDNTHTPTTIPTTSHTKAHTLRQRQLVRVVDGARGAPHVLLPRVRPALPAVAGLLVPAKRAANLGAAGAAVDVHDAAVGPERAHPRLRPAHVPGEEGGRQPLRHAIVHGDRLLKRAKLEHVQDRHKQLRLDDGGGVVNRHHRRLHKIFQLGGGWGDVPMVGR